MSDPTCPTCGGYMDEQTKGRWFCPNRPCLYERIDEQAAEIERLRNEVRDPRIVNARRNGKAVGVAVREERKLCRKRYVPEINELWRWQCRMADEIRGLRLRAEQAEARVAELEEAARHFDEILLRPAFDAGIVAAGNVDEICVDPWGMLSGFRRTFGLRPTMSAEEWAIQYVQSQRPIGTHEEESE